MFVEKPLHIQDVSTAPPGPILWLYPLFWVVYEEYTDSEVFYREEGPEEETQAALQVGFHLYWQGIAVS